MVYKLVVVKLANIMNISAISIGPALMFGGKFTTKSTEKAQRITEIAS